jgi:hypothetical protein
MSWGQTERIVLVWPVEGSVLKRKLDIILVNRHAASMGAQLGLITHDSAVRFYARQMGIPVFTNFRHAQAHPWEVNRPEKIDLHQNSQQHNHEHHRNNIHPPAPAWMEHPVTRFICLGISVFALLILGIFILPSAKIILSPRVEIQSMRFDLYADPSSTTINLSTNHLPTYNSEVIVEGSDIITATGSMIIPDDPALGDLKFTNNSKQAIDIPVGTIVATLDKDPVRFITKSAGAVTVYPNKSVIVTARAIKPGSSGNLLPKKLVVIEGDLRMNLTVTNPNATQGGTDATVPTPTEHDFHILSDHLRNQLKQAALTEMQSILPSEDTLITPTISMIETLNETSIPLIGEPGNQIELTMRLRFQSQAVSGEVLRSLVTPILDSNIPSGYLALRNSLAITQLTTPSLAQDGIAHWTVAAVRKLQVVIKAYQAIDLVRGETVANAKEDLTASLPLMDKAQIFLIPTWWPRLPFMSMRIRVAQAEIP